MKIKINNNLMQRFFISSLLFCGIFFIFFNVNFSYNETKVEITKSCFATVGGEKTTTEKRNVGGYEVDATTGSNLAGVIKWLLFSIIAFFAWLITFGITLIDFTLTPEFQSILRMDAVKSGWDVVRDFLNIAFIFFLLFSAFATIFQVSKYHIKSTWVMIVVMALLVNFSWPISRIIIDISNVTMNYIINGGTVANTNTGNVTEGNALMQQIGDGSGFAAAIVGINVGNAKRVDNNEIEVVMDEIEWVNLFMGIVFSFMFMVTIMAIAMILVIRTIALAVLIIFASVGFIAAAFPSTKSFSSSWWSSLLKYAFIGPILIFMLFLSSKIMMDVSNDKAVAYNTGLKTAVAKNANGMTPTLTNGIIHGMKFIVPIVLLWTAIIAAGKLGDGASSMVVGRARAAIQGAGNKIKKHTVDRGVNASKRVAGAGVNKLKTGAGNLYDDYEAKTGLTALRRSKANAKKKKEADRKARREEDIANSSGYNTEERTSAQRKIENGKFVEEKKNISEKGTTASESEMELTQVDSDGNLKVKSEGQIRAKMDNAMRGDNFGKNKESYNSLVKSVGQIKDDDVRKEMMGKLNKSYVEKGNSHLVYNEELEKQKQKVASSVGRATTNLTRNELNTARKEASKKIYSGMDAKTLAKQEGMMENIEAGNADSEVVKEVINQKLDRAEFARHIQGNANEGMYTKFKNINDSKLS